MKQIYSVVLKPYHKGQCSKVHLAWHLSKELAVYAFKTEWRSSHDSLLGSLHMKVQYNPFRHFLAAHIRPCGGSRGLEWRGVFAG